MIYVVISTFPPLRDGIARYADQQVDQLRAEGKKVLTVGLLGSEADTVLDMSGGLRPLRLLPHLQAACKGYLHWHDEFYYRGGLHKRLLTSLALGWLYRKSPQLEIICHEAYNMGKPPRGVVRRLLHGLSQHVQRHTWLAAPKVIFHSSAERDKMETAVGVKLDDARVEIHSHGASFIKYRDVNQTQARQELGISKSTVFLCIGFLGKHKGFHHALEAFRGMKNHDTQLYVVGSMLYDTEPSRAYVQHLHELAKQILGATVIEKFLTDEEFDTWIMASDYVVTPYEGAYSSGVIERAKLFEKPIIASRVGGLPEQLTARDSTFSTFEELERLMWQAADSKDNT